MEFKNFRNYEVLNEKPRIAYAECDYIGATGFQKVYGYVQKNDEETLCIFNANVSDKIKSWYKKSCIENILHPKQYVTIEMEKEGVSNV